MGAVAKREKAAKVPARKMGRPTWEEIDPDRVNLTLDLIANGCAHHEIAQATGLTMMQVYRIEKRNADKLPPAEQRLRTKWERAANLAVSVLTQRLDEDTFTNGQLAFAAGIATDKYQNLSGAPSAIVQHVSKPDPDELRKAIMEAARDIRRAEAIDDGSGLIMGKDNISMHNPPTSGVIPASSKAR